MRRKHHERGYCALPSLSLPELDLVSCLIIPGGRRASARAGASHFIAACRRGTYSGGVHKTVTVFEMNDTHAHTLLL